MPQFSSSDYLLIALAVGCPAVWGVACGIYERVLLAPRRRLSSFGAAYAPSMLLALCGGWFALIGPDGVRFFFALLMAALFFMLGTLPTMAMFYLSRWILHTRFADEKEAA
jgi:hypothetical protein